MSLEYLAKLAKLIEERKRADPQESYTASLYKAGEDAILKKIGEETTETILAAKSGNNQEIIHEMADLWFHSMVLLSYHKIPLEALVEELHRRSQRSGIDEKHSRNR